ncbi:hypothetical protein HK413_09515 [Mucilaginibacter sp. S1162]|uniref:Uncharacterized protein n=1 Tax=Mucilaginibacter humi TaxID=2732510 RepID=A0ABX1W3T9_9SPHI|nr:hypothetical protein [Mucilaginibacter humi]NNU34326.1 hypothetical protein [Mucilaginibacter humi]
MPWLSIAATVLVVLTAGILFLQKTKSTGDQPKENKLVASRVEPAKTVTPVQSAETVIAKPAAHVASTVNHLHNVIPSVNNTQGQLNNTTESVVKPTEPVKNDQQPLIAAVPNPASTHVSTATVPDVTLAPKMLDAVPQVDKPVMATQSAAPAKNAVYITWADW